MEAQGVAAVTGQHEKSGIEQRLTLVAALADDHQLGGAGRHRVDRLGVHLRLIVKGARLRRAGRGRAAGATGGDLQLTELGGLRRPEVVALRVVRQRREHRGRRRILGQGDGLAFAGGSRRRPVGGADLAGGVPADRQ
ncbi:MAG: hypothetical protein ABSA02_31930 [Trebonia sp.]|jgi:hypothetical protein